MHEAGVDHGRTELGEAIDRSADQEPLVDRRPGHLQRASGLGDDEPGGRVVPDVRTLLDVGIEMSRGDRTEVEGAGAEPSDVADAREQLLQIARLAGARRLLVAEAGADQPLRQGYDVPGTHRAAVAGRSTSQC